MTSALDHLPECRERGCKITMRHSVTDLVVIYQHGDNSEAVTVVNRLFRGTPQEAAESAIAQVRRFTESCHRYDEERVLS